MKKFAAINFKTTGASPGKGDRPIEVAVVRVEAGKVIEHFTSLLNSGMPIPAHIQRITGLSDADLRRAPPASEVMHAVADLIGKTHLVAHKWGFHGRFLEAELSRIGLSLKFKRNQHEGVCTMKLTRRVYPDAPDHTLMTLTKSLGLPLPTRPPTALTDAEMAAHLMIRIQADLKRDNHLTRVPYKLLCQVQNASKANVAQEMELAKQALGL